MHTYHTLLQDTKRNHADMNPTNKRARAVTGGGRVEAARPKYPPPPPADYRCYTPTSFRKKGPSQSKDRPNKGGIAEKIASEAYRAKGGIAWNSIANHAIVGHKEDEVWDILLVLLGSRAPFCLVFSCLSCYAASLCSQVSWSTCLSENEQEGALGVLAMVPDLLMLIADVSRCWKLRT